MDFLVSLNPQLSVCIDAVYEGVDEVEAISRVAQCGVGAFEFWCWWEKNLDRIVKARDDNGLTIASCCTKFVSLVDPTKRDEYLQGLNESIDAAQRIDCKTLISQVGDFRPGVPREEQHQSLVDGLRQAAPMLEQAGITLVIEPLNELVDHVGYYLVRSDEAFEIVGKVGSENVKVVFDIYHQQISEGHVIDRLTRNVNDIAHFHAAGNPGRNELTRGELNYHEIFAAIRKTNYRGYVGLEYWPVGDPDASLKEAVAMCEKDS
ncbi:Xylose isomerase-type TIM barrel domain protein [Rhodopirellula sallentina SM41]|uniref:Xylose isomerase-type TIM barrel domain protein n=1 Tax=Rhodopirellula sallentina SM41 TaxID=1263870 RepID=M5U3Z2_9BACT|nr:Xylose isomerase-type TIM barrel domain protein [Rhodopirellula sallentina SM41]